MKTKTLSGTNSLASTLFNMEIVYEKPPIWDEALRVFGFDPTRNVIFAYGDKLYNPNNAYISDDLIAHERVHSHQQREMFGGVEEWWRRYFADPVFRLEQEVEAYQTQYYFLSTHIKDKNKLHKELRRLAGDLSGGLYGDVDITFSEAERLIKQSV